MAGKNEKVDFLSEIGSMVKSQKEENQILRRKKAENRIDEPELSVEVEKEDQQPMAAPKEDREVKTVQRLLKRWSEKRP